MSFCFVLCDYWVMWFFSIFSIFHHHHLSLPPLLLLLSSVNRCHSAICLRGDLITSCQCFSVDCIPVFEPISTFPINSLRVTRSWSYIKNFKWILSKLSSDGISNMKLSLNTGDNVRRFICVRFFEIRSWLWNK